MMKRLYTLVGCGLAGFLDLSVGIFITYIASYISDYHILAYQYLLGSFCALIPDIDLLYARVYKNDPYVNHHQYITHRPLFGILIVLFVCIWVGEIFWIVIAPICICWHYVHDTKGFGGSGIAWLWPYSYDNCSPFDIYKTNDTLKVNEYRIENIWLTPTKLSIIEIIIGSMLLGCIIWHIFNFIYMLLIVMTILLLTSIVWLTFPYIKNEVRNG